MRIKSKVVKVNCTIKRELTSDLICTYGIKQNMHTIYHYKTTSKFELKLIERNLYVLLKDFSDIYYSTNDKITRKLKLLSIDNFELYNNIKKVINKSESISAEDFMTTHLSIELAKGIDCEIINHLRNLSCVFKDKKHKSIDKKILKKISIIKKVINKC